MLLEGPWGSGKSFFVDTYFKDRFDKARAADPDAKDPLIHVTLLGVRELSDLTTQMFEKAPVLGGKAAKLVNTVLSRAVGVLGASLDASENAGLLQDMVLNLKDRIRPRFRHRRSGSPRGWPTPCRMQRKRRAPRLFWDQPEGEGP